MSAILLVIGILGPWQRAIFGFSQNGLEIAPIPLAGATLLAAYALYLYDRGDETHRKRIGRLLIGAAILTGLVVAVNASQIGGLVLAGWGPVVAGVGSAGLLIAGVTILGASSLAA